MTYSSMHFLLVYHRFLSFALIERVRDNFDFSFLPCTRYIWAILLYWLDRGLL